MMRRAQPWLGTLVEISVADTGLVPAADSMSNAGFAPVANLAASAGLAPVTASAAAPLTNTSADATAQAALQQAISQAFAEVALVQRLMSFHDPASDISRLNRAWAGEVLPVHPHTWQVLRLAQQVADQSDGIFNIACAPRLVAWDCLPSPQAGNANLPAYQPGVAVLRCEANSMVRKMVQGWVDLGGIAKGYAVDLAIAALERAGVRSACVNAGGDLRAIGEEAWPVAIRDPRAPGRAGARVTLRGEALATSADYFSAKRHDGMTVGALLDGRSGQPVTGGASVSVRAARCAVADALTKVVLASGDPRHPALLAMDATALII